MSFSAIKYKLGYWMFTNSISYFILKFVVFLLNTKHILILKLRTNFRKKKRWVKNSNKNIKIKCPDTISKPELHINCRIDELDFTHQFAMRLIAILMDQHGDNPSKEGRYERKYSCQKQNLLYVMLQNICFWVSIESFKSK